MQKISTSEELKIAIRLAEEEQSISRKLLKEQFLLTLAMVKPKNLLLSTIKELASSSNLVKFVAVTTIGLTTGFLAKKIIIGTSSTVLRLILAGSKNVNAIDSFGKKNSTGTQQ